MATSSILGGTHAPAEAAGKDVDALGPSDSSDSGSDVQTDRNRSALPDEGSEGAFPIAHGSTTDAAGTGEQASADPVKTREDGDVLPDRTGTFPPGGGGTPNHAGADAVDDLEADDEEPND